MDAEYTRRDENGVTIFRVSPARFPGFFNRMVLGAAAFGAFTVVQFIINLILGEAVAVVVALAAGAYAFFFMRGVLRRNEAPVEVRVDASDLHVVGRRLGGDVSIPLDDLAELSILDGRTNMPVRTTSSFVVVGSPAVVAGVAAVHSINQAVEGGVRMYAGWLEGKKLLLRARRRSHSKPEPLVYGLTQEAALALMDDLSTEIGPRLQRGSAQAS